MAIWQFQCNIIPLGHNIDRLNHGEMISWKEVSQPSNEIKFLELEKSWSKDIVQYGKTEETCIEFIYNKGMLEEISCRLDLRSLTKQKLVLLIEYVQKIEAMFLVGDMIYPPKVEVLVEAMKHSKANQYCKAPLDYILAFSETEQH